jgi:hypothetical protein
VTLWLLLWLVISLVAAGALTAICVALVKRLVVLGRALQQFQDEVQPAGDATTRDSSPASARGSAIGERSSFRRA